jgi:uncharacterized delta-60 repeat protein
MMGVGALTSGTYRRVAVSGLACLLISLTTVAPAVAAPGRLDTSFGRAGHGTVRTQTLSHPLLRTEVAMPLSGSRLLLAGKLQHGGTGLVILRPDGALDRRFGRHGLKVLPGRSGFYFYGEEFGDPVAVDQRGRILIAEPGKGLAAVRRLLPGGRLDRSFGTGGVARVGFGGQSTEGTSVAVQPGGKILVGGATGCADYGCTKAPALARLTESGHLDPGFGDDGHEILSRPYQGEEPRVMGLTAGPGGEIFAVSGGYASNLTIQRLGRNGPVDRSFGRRGRIIVGQAGPARSGLFTLPKIAVTSDGKLVVGGHVELHGGSDAMVAFRYLADGRPDPSFGRDGHVVLKVGIDAFTEAIAVRPDGGVVLCANGVGKKKSYLLVAALRPDGTSDPAVGKHGVAEIASGDTPTALVFRGSTALAIGYTESPSKIDPRKKLTRTVLVRVPLSP